MTKIPHPTALLRAQGRADPAFLLRFPLILDPAEVSPPPKKDDLVLLSPEYAWIKWAKGKGLRAVWLNPAGEKCPEAHPWHDLEIGNLTALQKPLSFRLPDIPEALDILRAQGVPEHVVMHSAAVAAVGYFLAQKLREKGIDVDPLLAHRGGLLHDLDKVASVHEEGTHGEKAAVILADLGYPALGEIARKHVLYPGRLPRTWEEKLVFLADKLVEGAEVVGIMARMAALKKRYPHAQKEISSCEPFVYALQNQLLLALEMSEEELLVALRKLPLSLPT
ncbi:MAG: HDIG domain-containing protein [Candidatus Bipolaricaulota bacterium]|nr:HDIG domain-containing protein [Candidatus Bipolaricaulota bacterium]MDW8126997.1 HDIG domain-containing protein [Candidatus Bipolaricaulota bacterium]